MAVYKVKDAVDDATIASIAQFHDVKAPGANYLEKKNPFAYTENKLLLKQDTIITLKNAAWKIFVVKDADLELSEADLDTGTFAVGTDYYVYLCDDGTNGVIKLSLNSTFPAGYSADSSRKIGGFHYGHIRKVSSDGLWIPIDSEGTKFGSGSTIWKNNVTTGIVPNSVWDLKNRPKCSPEGMVKIGQLWVDIYQSSAAEAVTFMSGTNGLHVATGKLQSKYGQLPVTGTEGLCWFNFAELATRSAKRMLSYAEWIKGAFGNPEGEDAADNYGWTKTTNTARTRTGVRVNASSGAYDAASGIKPYAISAYNLVDCVGNVYDWLDEMSIRQDSTSWAWQDVLGAGMGDLYGPNNIGLSALIAGGNWGEGVHFGPRCVHLGNFPWYVHTGIGCRLACDAA